MIVHKDLPFMKKIDQSDTSEYMVEVEDIKKYFPIKGGILQRTIGYVYAVDDINLKIRKGETLGVVGESGCGKTTLGRLILGLTDPTGGTIKFRGQNLTSHESKLEERIFRLKQRVLGLILATISLFFLLTGIFYLATGSFDKNIPTWGTCFFIFLVFLALGVRVLSQPSPIDMWSSQKMQIVFQDPYASLNARFTARKTLSEPIIFHKIMKKKDIDRYLVSLLEEVGLSAVHLSRYPHEFSGGQRQRITIARALVLDPDFIVLDEPTASADVSVRAKILNLLKELQKKRNLTYMFISHDLSIIEYISDRIAVMYLGHIVEIGPKYIFRKKDPIHPYTRALLSAIPIPDPEVKQSRIILEGDVPSSVNPPSGCVFHTRCPQAMKMCTECRPRLRDVEYDHQIACHLYDTDFVTVHDSTPLKDPTISTKTIV